MSCCCENKINLGCFDVCEDLSTGVLAAEDGTYTLEFKFMTLRIKTTRDLLIGDEVVIPKDYLNENSEYELTIKTPSGTNTCYKFNTKPCIVVS